MTIILEFIDLNKVTTLLCNCGILNKTLFVTGFFQLPICYLTFLPHTAVIAEIFILFLCVPPTSSSPTTTMITVPRVASMVPRVPTSTARVPRMTKSADGTVRLRKDGQMEVNPQLFLGTVLANNKLFARTVL